MKCDLTDATVVVRDVVHDFVVVAGELRGVAVEAESLRVHDDDDDDDVDGDENYKSLFGLFYFSGLVLSSLEV